MPFQLSPGVAVVEKDFTSIVPAVSSSIGAFAGTFPWGPTLEPVTVSSENDLVRRFGKPNDSNFQSFFTAANFLSYTNNLLLVRADTGSLNAVADKTGGVSTFTVDTAGSGYNSKAAAPAVTIGAPNQDGGIQAVGTAVLSGGAITAVAVASGGTGYSTAPSVVITSTGGGSGATFSVQTSGTTPNLVVTGITVLTGGTGYKGTVTASFSGGGGSGGSAGAVSVASSSITGVTVNTAGTGYTSAPSVTVAAPPSGVTAVVTANVNTAGLKIANGETYNSTYINGAGVVGEFAAKYPGTAGNSLLVSVADADTYAAWAYKAEFDSAPGTSTYAANLGGVNDELHIIVIDEDGIFTGTPGTVIEKFAFISKANDAKKSDGTNNYYKNVVNSRSEYIWWMDHPTDVTGTTAWGSVAQNATFKSLTTALTYSLDGGTDDFSATDGQLETAYQLFDNAERYDISLVLAGAASTTVANYIIGSVCETRLDCVAFISPQDIDSGDPIIGSSSTQADKIVAYRDLLPSTSYAVMDSGYKYQYDRYNDKYRWIPLNADVAGLCARTDYTNDPWFSPGGLNRGQIKNVVRLAFSPNKTNRDTLYKSGVNPVVTFPGEGTVLFGDKTLLAKPSAFDRINVRRLFIVMEKAIATAAKFQLFEFNDGFTRAQFKNLVEPFLRDVQGRRGITDFVVKCDEANNTGEVIDRNEFVADIFVKPNRSINFITLNFVAARSAINFSEIGA
jgi:phage tail sheath protein FI